MKLLQVIYILLLAFAFLGCNEKNKASLPNHSDTPLEINGELTGLYNAILYNDLEMFALILHSIETSSISLSHSEIDVLVYKICNEKNLTHKNRIKMLESFLQSTGHVNLNIAQNKQVPFLHMLAQCSSNIDSDTKIHMAEILLSHGVDLNYLDSANRSAVVYAGMFSDRHYYEYLIEASRKNSIPP